MLDTTQIVVDAFVKELKTWFTACFGEGEEFNEHIDLLEVAAHNTMAHLIHSDALYHNYEHTILVTSVGQHILIGRQQLESNVEPDIWVNVILSLLCHDIGYSRELCSADTGSLLAKGINDERINVAVGSSDACLMPYHVDRGQLFIRENYSTVDLIDTEFVCSMIERTRFPIPDDTESLVSGDYPGLVRGADLIGQLSDPRYLAKLTAIFYEFEENGFNSNTGYTRPGDLLMTYPAFFNERVLPYLGESLLYLRQTESGQQVLDNLQANVDASIIAAGDNLQSVTAL